MSDGLPEASDRNVERIASNLLDYIVGGNMFRETLKFAICEALYEMKAITSGQDYRPTVQVFETAHPDCLGQDGEAGEEN